jgi:hypothetical protein
VGLTMTPDISEIASLFDIRGEFYDAAPYGSGHINDTFCATYRHGDKSVQFIHQRLNTSIFKNPRAVMENILRVTQHIKGKIEGHVDPAKNVLTLVPSRGGEFFSFDSEGGCWRTYEFIQGAKTYDVVGNPHQAFQAAKAFGEFQMQLVDLPAPRLHDTIPDFHHTPKRFSNLEKAIEADSANRARSAKRDIEFALKRKGMTGRLVDLQAKGEIPERITHNDTKFNNVMLDDETGEAVCVIDLDTVMPGQALYDFGDMVRTTTCSTAEDERDLSKVEMSMPMYEGLLRGYLETAGPFLTKAEKENLAFSGRLITFEIGIRFLTDYLMGDTYFKVHRPDQNLDRARAQFKLVESIERQEEAMNGLLMNR